MWCHVLVQHLLVSLDNIRDAFVHGLKVPVCDQNLVGDERSAGDDLRSRRTAISSILSVRGFNPVISQSIHTSGPAAKSKGFASMPLNVRSGA